MNQLEILYEDREILVVHKPAGLAVQTKSFGQKDMESLLKNHLASEAACSERSKGTVPLEGEGTAPYECGNGKVPYLGIVHRLDQPVEGVMVFARTPQAAAFLSGQAAGQTGQRSAEGRQMRKEYLAVVCSGAGKGKGQLRDWLLKDSRTNTSRVVKKGTRGAREALLEYEVLESMDDKSLVRVELDTGRHHQIRVQLAHAGMPLWGDAKYNPAKTGGQLALCAYRLTFMHPASRKRMTFSVAPGNPVFAGFTWKDGEKDGKSCSSMWEREQT